MEKVENFTKKKHLWKSSLIKKGAGFFYFYTHLK
jgi:hypothetical protein